MNQVKLDVVKQEMARLNIDILGISKLRWTGMGEFNSDAPQCASKVILKIHQARLQQYRNHELPDVQAGFRKGRGTRDQIAAFVGS